MLISFLIFYHKPYKYKKMEISLKKIRYRLYILREFEKKNSQKDTNN